MECVGKEGDVGFILGFGNDWVFLEHTHFGNVMKNAAGVMAYCDLILDNLLFFKFYF